MSDQAPLFDVATTTTRSCPVPGCGSIAFPGQTRTPTCHIDLERATGDWVKRPANCLNHPRPETDPFPEGF